MRKFLVLIALPILISACSKGPSKSTMKELLLVGQDKALSLNDFKISKEEYKDSNNEYTGHEDYFITELDLDVKVESDCLSRPSDGAPSCTALDEIRTKRNSMIAEIQKKTQSCFMGAGCIPFSEKNKKEEVAKLEKFYEKELHSPDIIKSGSKKNYRVGVVFYKNGNEKNPNWKIEKIVNLDKK